MACNDNTNRPAQITSDRGVKYTGEDIESLGICQGDYLDEVSAVILEKLQDYAAGTGITLDDLDFTECAFMESFISCCAADKSLPNIMTVVFKALCQLKGEVEDVVDDVATVGTAATFNIIPGCLTVANNKIDTVLNKLISEFCTLKTDITDAFGENFDDISTTIVNVIADEVITAVFNNIQGCSAADVVKSGSGLSTTITIKGINPIGTILFGEWDASYFDATGLGLASKGMCGFAVCNGLNGTTDWRGFTPAMATNIYSSQSLHFRVDPVSNADASYGTNVGDVQGEVKHTLTSYESGQRDHIHTVTQTPHTHANGSYDRLLQYTGTSTTGSTDNNNLTGTEPDVARSATIASANANITIDACGGDNALLAHENRQPTRYVYCIKRIA